MAGTFNSISRDQAQPPTSSAGGADPFVSIAVLSSLFFMWGFLTCMNDVLIPHLKEVFELGYARAMLVQFAFFAAYFVMSLPAGRLVELLGYKRGIVVGLLVAALGCAAFYPAAALHSYPLFLAALFVLASGITQLQVAANPFVAALGKPETASARLTLTQAFNSLGTTLAPVFGSLLILSDSAGSKAQLATMNRQALEAYRASEAASVQGPYLGLAATLVLLAIGMAAVRLPELATARAGAAAGAGQSIWSERRLVLGALAIFLYVGGEVAIGSFLVSFFKEPAIGALSDAEGARLVSFYWGGAMLGRFLGSLTLRTFRPGRVLCVHALGALALIVLAMSTQGNVAVYSILVVGLFNSIMFPTIFALAIDGLGERTGQGSGIVCMAIVGGALIPVVQGMAADALGIQRAFAVAALCYAYVAWYGLKCSSRRTADSDACSLS